MITMLSANLRLVKSTLLPRCSQFNYLNTSSKARINDVRIILPHLPVSLLFYVLHACIVKKVSRGYRVKILSVSA